MKTIWQPYDHPMHTHENPMKHLWEVSLYIMRREAPRQNIEWFHRVLCGAQRRGEISECFYGTLRQILRNIRNPSQFECFKCVLRSAMRRSAQLGGSTVTFILCGAQRRGENLSGSTVYYVARSAAAKFLRSFTIYNAKSVEIWKSYRNP